MFPILLSLLNGSTSYKTYFTIQDVSPSLLKSGRKIGNICG
uniref:Uncharacterized protein n=1 Tax=Rhizophora mucronata TaxID=61149 RepID=A0A2P2NQU7_RHIMU